MENNIATSETIPSEAPETIQTQATNNSFSTYLILRTLGPVLIVQALIALVKFQFKSRNTLPTSKTTDIGLIKLNNFITSGERYDFLACLSTDNNLEWEEITYKNVVWSELDLDYTHSTYFHNLKKNIPLHLNFSDIPANGNIFLHFFIIPHKVYNLRRIPIFDSTISENSNWLWNISFPLITYYSPPVYREKYSLLDSYLDNDLQHNHKLLPEPRMKIQTDLNLLLIYYTKTQTITSLKDNFFKDFSIDLKSMNYYPPLIINNFWVAKNNFVELENLFENKNINLKLNFRLSSQIYWHILSSFQQNLDHLSKLGLDSHEEFTRVKEIFVNTNLTSLVCSLSFLFIHTFLSLFYFPKETTYFFKFGRVNNELPIWSNIFLFISKIIILLYLLDQPESSHLVIFEYSLGLALFFWHLIAILKLGPIENFSLYKLDCSLKDSKNKIKDPSLDFGEFLMKILFPIMLGFALYSLYYDKHYSWYSYFIFTLTQISYIYQFIVMVIPLYKNYINQSVENLSWKDLIQRAMNPWVDDTVSILTDAPVLYKLASLQDDIIVVLYFFQRCLYTSKDRDTEPSKPKEN